MQQKILMGHPKTLLILFKSKNNFNSDRKTSKNLITRF